MELQDAVHGKELEEVIGDVMNGKWDHQRSKFSLPPLMNLVSTILFTINSASIVIWNPMVTQETLICFMTKYFDEKMPLPS